MFASLATLCSTTSDSGSATVLWETLLPTPSSASLPPSSASTPWGPSDGVYSSSEPAPASELSRALGLPLSSPSSCTSSPASSGASAVSFGTSLLTSRYPALWDPLLSLSCISLKSSATTSTPSLSSVVASLVCSMEALQSSPNMLIQTTDPSIASTWPGPTQVAFWPTPDPRGAGPSCPWTLFFLRRSRYT